MKNVKTRHDISTRLQRRVKLNAVQADWAVNEVIDALTDMLADGYTIQLRGFGTLKVVERKAKSAYNFEQGKSLRLPAYNTVKFIPYNALKARLG